MTVSRWLSTSTNRGVGSTSMVCWTSHEGPDVHRCIEVLGWYSTVGNRLLSSVLGWVLSLVKLVTASNRGRILGRSTYWHIIWIEVHGVAGTARGPLFSNFGLGNSFGYGVGGTWIRTVQNHLILVEKLCRHHHLLLLLLLVICIIRCLALVD